MDTQYAHPCHPFSMLGGVIITIFHLKQLLTMDIEHALRTIIVDALTILAVLEIFRTTLAYFSEGRVKVTYIVDTVIVVLLTEIMACWFKEFNLYCVLCGYLLLNILPA